jgi:hypothetical protein
MIFVGYTCLSVASRHTVLGLDNPVWVCKGTEKGCVFYLLSIIIAENTLFCSMAYYVSLPDDQDFANQD